MKKWAHISQRKADEFVRSYETKEKAIAAATYDWEMRSNYEKADKERHEVVAFVNLNEKDSWVELENGEIDGDWYDLAWMDGEYK